MCVYMCVCPFVSHVGVRLTDLEILEPDWLHSYLSGVHACYGGLTLLSIKRSILSCNLKNVFPMLHTRSWRRQSVVYLAQNCLLQDVIRPSWYGMHLWGLECPDTCKHMC